jgi:hypothetical protein
MKHILFAMLLTAALPFAAAAQSDGEVYDRIEALHGDPIGFNNVYDQVKEALLAGDAATVAQFASYPLTVHANGEVYDVLEEQDLVDNFDRLVMLETRYAVANQEYRDLFVNSDGVMAAGGAVWFGAICEDSSCSSSYWTIISINN